MYIVNPKVIKNKIKCRGAVAKYFITQNIPVLSKDGSDYYFADSEIFKEALYYAPSWVKILMRLGL